MKVHCTVERSVGTHRVSSPTPSQFVKWGLGWTRFRMLGNWITQVKTYNFSTVLNLKFCDVKLGFELIFGWIVTLQPSAAKSFHNGNARSVNKYELWFRATEKCGLRKKDDFCKYCLRMRVAQYCTRNTSRQEQLWNVETRKKNKTADELLSQIKIDLNKF